MIDKDTGYLERRKYWQRVFDNYKASAKPQDENPKVKPIEENPKKAA